LARGSGAQSTMLEKSADRNVRHLVISSVARELRAVTAVVLSPLSEHQVTVTQGGTPAVVTPIRYSTTDSREAHAQRGHFPKMPLGAGAQLLPFPSIHVLFQIRGSFLPHLDLSGGALVCLVCVEMESRSQYVTQVGLEHTAILL